jgi:hypothetical protein
VTRIDAIFDAERAINGLAAEARICARTTVIRPRIPRTSDRSFHGDPTIRSISIRPG